MTIAQQYFAPKYFHARFWNGGYFGGYLSGFGSSGYFARYFHARYFHAHYWNHTDVIPNVLGSMAATLGELAAALLGSVVNPAQGFSGAVLATLDPLGVRFDGSVSVADYFDLSVVLTPNWESIEYPGFAGSIDVTVDPLGCNFVGTALADQARVGVLAATFEDLTAVLQGSSVAPPSRLGFLSATLDPIVLSGWIGSAIPPDASVCVLDGTFETLRLDALGSAFIPLRTGMLDAELADLQCQSAGVSVVAGTRIGTLNAMFADLRCEMQGTGPGLHQSNPDHIILVRSGTSRVIKVRRPR